MNANITALVQAAREADIAMSRVLAGVSTGAITSDHDETMAYTINHMTSWRNELRQALAAIEQQPTGGGVSEEDKRILEKVAVEYLKTPDSYPQSLPQKDQTLDRKWDSEFFVRIKDEMIYGYYSASCNKIEPHHTCHLSPTQPPTPRAEGVASEAMLDHIMNKDEGVKRVVKMRDMGLASTEQVIMACAHAVHKALAALQSPAAPPSVTPEALKALKMHHQFALEHYKEYNPSGAGQILYMMTVNAIEQARYNVTEKLSVQCPDCEGQGWVSGSEAGCCGNVTSTGECCGNAIEVQAQIQCINCNGCGQIPTPHEQART